ncbi:hypothetical protein BOTBODRAFT_174674 [Botryobasidium botryosum FD-172 SS1]|uniref:FAD-binding PCMH-type domain-containing protein n=1 Tax=Botryobasidium botryosum (strain FD-172 SS1) TaxID=930990 RepID=A0A067MFC1_BOTB1|nr:hypothetical protein BOTBODRAFT_174674 [Botryobasidium botryosum FD-172 SS1]
MLNRALTTISLLLYAVAAAEQVPFDSEIYHCTASDPCWPSDPAWAHLNRTLSGHLIRSRPSASPCHDPHYDAQACEEAKRSWHDSFWRARQPGGYQDIAWEGGDKPCFIDTPRDAPCGQAYVPYYTAAVKSVEDVQAAVVFAQKYHLRTRIKGASHDYQGRSAGKGSFGIYTMGLKGVQFYDDYVPSGCSVPPQQAVTVAAGEHLYDANKAADERGVIVIGGYARTVGMSGGWILGGGHSPLSPQYGLGVDNVLQFNVVTADGKARIANECQNPDLFWALRGGGGGFAAITFKTHPALTNILSAFIGVQTPPSDQYPLIKTFLSLQTTLADANFTGYAISYALGTAFYLFSPNFHGTIAEANATLAPIYDVVESSNGEMSAFSDIRVLPSYFSIYAGEGFPEGGQTTVVGSRLFPRSVFESEEETEGLARFLAEYPQGKMFNLVGGGKAMEPQPDAMGVNPSWRRALQHIILFGSMWGKNTTIHEQDLIRRDVTEATQALGNFAPDMGSYTNEADPDEPNWQHVFWGANYPRLLDIKKKYDPTGVLTCPKCVGDDVFGS